MTKPMYESGVQKPGVPHGPDPHNEFSQEAAKNKKPPNGVGLSENPGFERSETDKSDFRGSAHPEADARGQSESNHAGGGNDGVSSANPRALSGNEDGDATFPLRRRE